MRVLDVLREWVISPFCTETALLNNFYYFFIRFCFVF
jgi:hypothetical protein